MKLRAILKEVTDQQSREMVTGIAEILRMVKDDANREQIAKRMMRKFDIEGVNYDPTEFMKLSNVVTARMNTNQSDAHSVVPNETEVQRIAAELTNR